MLQLFAFSILLLLWFALAVQFSILHCFQPQSAAFSSIMVEMATFAFSQSIFLLEN